jgi:16S rRNA processing protein RimM
LIDQDNHSIIGNIVKPHGIDGTVNIRLNGPFADEIVLEEPLFILLDGVMVPFFIEEIRPAGNTAIVKLEFIDSEDRARVLNGKEIYVEQKRKKSYQTSIALNPMHSLLGFTLVDINSDFSGLIENFIESELNPLLLVKSGKKESMIPYQADLIANIDAKKKILFINLPEGLIDMD